MWHNVSQTSENLRNCLRFFKTQEELLQKKDALAQALLKNVNKMIAAKFSTLLTAREEEKLLCMCVHMQCFLSNTPGIYCYGIIKINHILHGLHSNNRS